MFENIDWISIITSIILALISSGFITKVFTNKQNRKNERWKKELERKYSFVIKQNEGEIEAYKVLWLNIIDKFYEVEKFHKTLHSEYSFKCEIDQSILIEMQNNIEEIRIFVNKEYPFIDINIYKKLNKIYEILHRIPYDAALMNECNDKKDILAKQTEYMEFIDESIMNAHLSIMELGDLLKYNIECLKE